MKCLNLCLLLMVFLPVVEAQIIFIPTGYPATYNYWECGTTNPQAGEYMEIGDKHFKDNMNVALVYYQGAIKADSMFCDAYDYAAIVFIRKENYDSAMKYIDGSLYVNSSNMWARNTRGRLHLTMKEYERASDYFFSQHMKQPDEGLWLYFLAESLFERDLLDSAKCITLNMQMIAQKQNYEIGVSMSIYMQKKMSDKRKENAIARTDLLQVKRNFYKDAVNNYYDGLTYEIAAKMGMYLQGKIFCKMAEYATAQRALLQVKHDFSKNTEYNYYLGLTYLYGEKPDLKKARKHIFRAFDKGFEVPLNVKNELNL